MIGVLAFAIAAGKFLQKTMVEAFEYQFAAAPGTALSTYKRPFTLTYPRPDELDSRTDAQKLAEIADSNRYITTFFVFLCIMHAMRKICIIEKPLGVDGKNVSAELTYGS